MTPQQANELLRNALLQARDWTGHADNIAIIDQALAATADCAPAPSEPAVDRDAVTVDHQKIKDAAYFLVLNKKDSFAKGWPLFVQIADEVLATPASPAVPEPIEQAFTDALMGGLGVVRIDPSTMFEPQVAQASQPTSAEGMTAWAAYCPAGFQFIHADQRVVEDFVYTRRYCGEGPYSIMHMKVSRPTSAEGKDSERLEGGVQ